MLNQGALVWEMQEIRLPPVLLAPSFFGMPLLLFFL